MKTFSDLIPKPTVSFKFEEVDVYTTYETIQKLKLSNARGNDSLTSRIIKETPQYNAMALCHLTNTIIRKRKYPKVLKCARILPLKKPGKEHSDPSSYRPISNLSVADKVVEELLQTQLKPISKAMILFQIHIMGGGNIIALPPVN